MSKAFHTDCLIIGSGIAGLSAALALAERGNSVTLISAAPEMREANTVYAQGGIIYEAAPAKSTGEVGTEVSSPSAGLAAPNRKKSAEEDTAGIAATKDPELLIQDIVEAGCGINYLPAVKQLAEQGPGLVRELLLDKARVPFDRDADGNYRRTREGAHSESRILYQGDESGKSIEESLLAYCRSLPSLRFLPATTAVNLLMSSYHRSDRENRHELSRCLGAFVFDQSSREVYPIYAQHTILATGGIGQLYYFNTNSKFARGDGLALATRAGCRTENLEYVQFHPTTFYHPQSRRFLISEALRGEGAILINQNGERFMEKYLPEYAQPELAPRDKVSTAIHQEMLSSSAPCVYLDLSHKPADWIRERFPFVYRSCLSYGVDITRQPIPVVPAAHYHCGGIWTDLEGRTSIARLWAAGEVACTGVHGANRLASTSLLEGLVWGTRAGRTIADGLARGKREPTLEIEPWESATATVDPAFLKQDWLTLKQTMWNYVGLIKTKARLRRAEGILVELHRGIDVFYRNAALSDELIGLRHASLAALQLLEACKKNPRSLGCYLRREELEI